MFIPDIGAGPAGRRDPHSPRADAAPQVVPTCSRMTSTDPRARPQSGELDGAELAGRHVAAGRASTATTGGTSSGRGTPNLVIRATPGGRQQISAARCAWELAGADGPHLGGARQLTTACSEAWRVLGRQRRPACPTAGDIMEFYGSLNWPQGRRFTPHRTERRGRADRFSGPGRRCLAQLAGCAGTKRAKFWRDYVDGAPSRTSRCRPSPSRSTVTRPTCAGRSSNPGTG